MKTFEEQVMGLVSSGYDKKDLIYDACNFNNPDSLQKILNICSDIYDEKVDITFDDGKLFSFAIAWEHTEVLSTLIDYYQKTQLNDLDKESLTYKYAKHKLEVIIADTLEAHTVSDKVLEIIKDYIPQEEATDAEDDLEDELADLSLQHDQLMHQEEQVHTDIVGSIDK